MPRTTTPSKAPQRVSIAVKVAGPLTNATRKNATPNTFITGRVNPTKGSEGSYTVTTAYGVFDLTANEKFTYEVDPRAAVDFHQCPKHKDDAGAMKVYPDGHFGCIPCWHEYTKARRQAKKDGTWEQRSQRGAAATAARNERVLAAAKVRDLTREQMLRNLFQGQTKAGAYVKGSAAKRDAYVRAMMTATMEQHHLTPAQVAELAGQDEFFPLSWTAYRKAFPNKADVEETEAA